MSIRAYFGSPGCGKSTILTKIACRERKRGRYEHIYTNFFCLGFEKIEFPDIGKFHYTNSLIILDEITIDADSREFKDFDKRVRDFFIYHRHLGNDIVYATQDYSRCDKIIRDLTEELYYVRSISPALPLLRKLIPVSKASRIFRTLDIDEHSHDIVYGYRFATLFERLFGRVSFFCWRPRFYKYFNSYSDPFTDRPEAPHDKWS